MIIRPRFPVEIRGLGLCGVLCRMLQAPKVAIEEENQMAVEQTLSIIKPDAVGKNVIGKILTRFEDNGLKIVAARMMHLTREQAGSFYEVHKERPFFNDLMEFMTSGPVFISVLKGDNAVKANRDIMGPTDPKEAPAGTIRGDFADSIDANAVHGSDSVENAEREVRFFFPDLS